MTEQVETARNYRLEMCDKSIPLTVLPLRKRTWVRLPSAAIPCAQGGNAMKLKEQYRVLVEELLTAIFIAHHLPSERNRGRYLRAREALLEVPGGIHVLRAIEGGRK